MKQAIRKAQNNKPFCIDKGVNELGYHCVELGFTTYMYRDSVIHVKDKITQQITPVSQSILLENPWIQENIIKVVSPIKVETKNDGFRECLGRNDKGNFMVRLGNTTYVYESSLIHKVNRDGSLEKLSLDEDVSKPWIRKQLDAEISFQLKKARAEIYQNYGYSPSERAAYRRSQKRGFAY